MAISPPSGGTPPPTPTDAEIDSFWLTRTIREWENELRSKHPEIVKWVTDEFGKRADLESMLFDLGVKLIPIIIEAINTAVVAGTPVAGELAAITMNQIMGSKIDPEQVKKDLENKPGRPALVDLGKQFTQVLDIMFPVSGTKGHIQNRGDRSFAVDNLDAYFGTNLNFQLRSLAIGTIGSLIPGKTLHHLEGLHQSINWAYGFGWLSWSVLAAIMGVTTTKPLTEYYNSQILGNDFSESEALHAFVQKRIDRATLDNVLNNQGMRPDIRDTRIEQTRTDLTAEQAVKGFIEGHIDAATFNRAMDHHGVRDDIRQAKIDMARPDLSESDIQEGFNNGLFTESDATDHYKEKGYEGFNLQAKLDLMKDQRLFKFRERLEAAFFHGYVIGTVTQSEFVNYLSSINYNDLEVQMELKRAEIMARSHLQKHLTRAEILRLVADGSMQATDGLQRLVAQGLPDADARRLLADAVLRHAVSLVPSKIRDACLGSQVEQNLLTAAITTVTELDPAYAVANKDFWAQAQCILQQYVTPSGGGGGTQPPPLQPGPQTLTALPGTGNVQLSWQPVPYLADYVVYRRKIGDATFIPVSLGSTATTYTDSGVTRGEIYIYRVTAKVNGVETAPSNEVQVQVV